MFYCVVFPCVGCKLSYFMNLFILTTVRLFRVIAVSYSSSFTLDIIFDYIFLIPPDY